MALDKGPLLGLLGVFCWVLKPVLRPQRKWTPASFRLWGPTTTKWGHPVRRPSPPRGCVLEYCCFVELPSVTTIISSPFISLGRNEMFCKLRSLLTGRSSLVVLHFHPFSTNHLYNSASNHSEPHVGHSGMCSKYCSRCPRNCKYCSISFCFFTFLPNRHQILYHLDILV